MAKSMKDLVGEARGRVDSIAPQAALDAQSKGDLILDVREPDELKSDGTVSGAVHVPRGLLEAQADPDTGKANAALVAMRQPGKRVHVLCASGARAVMAADRLREMGYDATVLEGGIAGWKEAGLPVEA